MVNNGYAQMESAKLSNDIAAGKFDDKLKAFAEELCAYPNVKYLIRLDYEVSGNLAANTNPSQFDQSTWDKQAYPKAFKHARSVISASLKNAQYVYHPVRGGAEVLYPGDDVVDYIGFSIFNNDVCLPSGKTQNCQGQEIDPNIKKDLQWAPKPKLITESAVQAPAARNNGDFTTYLDRVNKLITTYNVAGWTYINSDWVKHGWTDGSWGDSRVEANPEAKAWWQKNIKGNSRFKFSS